MQKGAEEVFLGTYENRIDEKGRVSVPARYRSILLEGGAKGMIAFPSYRSASIECCSYHFMENLQKRTENIDFFSEEQEDWSLALFSAASELTIDGEGRIVLPSEFSSHASLQDKAIFVGRGSLFQIWAPGRIAPLRKQARERLSQKGASLPSDLGVRNQST